MTPTQIDEDDFDVNEESSMIERASLPLPGNRKFSEGRAHRDREPTCLDLATDTSGETPYTASRAKSPVDGGKDSDTESRDGDIENGSDSEEGEEIFVDQIPLPLATNFTAMTPSSPLVSQNKHPGQRPSIRCEFIEYI